MPEVVIRGPRDLPTLRDRLLESWLPGGAYAATAAMMPGTMVTQVEHEAGAAREPDFHLRTLVDASLWWVSAEMCEVLAAAERTVPPDTILEAELVPRSSGLVVFERPLYGLDAQRDDAGPLVRVDAMCWGPVHLAELQQVIGGGTVRVAEPRRLRDGLGMVSYSRYNADDGLAGHELDHALVTGAIGQATRGPVFREGSNLSFHVHGDVWAWLGRGDWLYGTPVEHRELPYTDSAFASIAEDRRRLAALWLLMTQPGIASVETSHGTRAERRRAERHGAATPTVQIIDVARRHTRTHANGDGEHRHVNVRYLVSGHWRRQAYGPHRAYRRPTWIAAHWRGPEDAPLSNVEHVRVLDTGEHR